MKNTDIALVVMIALVTTVVSYFLGNALLGDPNEKVTTVNYMDVISADVGEPDEESFNVDALNPTVEVYVGNCGPMEVWDANAKVCRSKVADETDEKSSDEDETDNKKKSDDNNESDEEDESEGDDTTESDTGE